MLRRLNPSFWSITLVSIFFVACEKESEKKTESKANLTIPSALIGQWSFCEVLDPTIESFYRSSNTVYSYSSDGKASAEVAVYVDSRCEKKATREDVETFLSEIESRPIQFSRFS